MQLDPVGTLFSNSWKRFEEKFGILMAIFFPPAILIVIGEVLTAQKMAPAILLGGVITLLGGFISVVAGVAMLVAVAKDKNFSESYAVGFNLFWATVWISILVCIAVVGGYFFLVIPGIMLAVQLALANYVLVLEGKHGMAALTESREYIKGFWWAYVGRGLLLFLIIVGIMLVIVLPVALILGGIVGGIVYAAVLVLFSPFSVCYGYELYENFRRLKPNAAEDAAKSKHDFLKVATVIGIVGALIMMMVFVIAIVLTSTSSSASLQPGSGNMDAPQPNAYGYTGGYGYPNQQQ